MNRDMKFLTKVLKDVKRQEIIILLATKGTLSYSEILDQTDVLTGILNYHLKVMGNLLQKDDLGHYTLSSEGQLAYRVLTDLPKIQPKALDERIYKAWIIITAASVILLVLNGYFLSIPIERTALALAILLLATAFAFYVKVKPSNIGNRAFFVLGGGFILGFILWVGVCLFFNASR